MSQNAIVKRNISSGVVEIALMRELECGNGCKNCDICTARPQEDLLANAADSIGVTVGDWVEVELANTTSVTAALLIYLLPCITLLAGYMIGEWLGFSVVASLGCAALGLALGFLPAWLVNRGIQKNSAPEFIVLKRK